MNNKQMNNRLYLETDFGLMMFLAIFTLVALLQNNLYFISAGIFGVFTFIGVYIDKRAALIQSSEERKK